VRWIEKQVKNQNLWYIFYPVTPNDVSSFQPWYIKFSLEEHMYCMVEIALLYPQHKYVVWLCSTRRNAPRKADVKTLIKSLKITKPVTSHLILVVGVNPAFSRSLRGCSNCLFAYKCILFWFLVLTIFCHTQYSGLTQSRAPQRNSLSSNLVQPPKDEYEDPKSHTKISAWNSKLYVGLFYFILHQQSLCAKPLLSDTLNGRIVTVSYIWAKAMQHQQWTIS